MIISARKTQLAIAIAATSLLAACGGDSDNDNNAGNGGGEQPATLPLTRLATIPLGAELTGLEVTENGNAFFNIQHPADSLPDAENKAAVGAWVGANINELPAGIKPVTVPDPTSSDAETTHMALGSYQVLGREGYNYRGDLPFGLGHITVLDKNEDSVLQSNDPDFNAWIADGEDSGYLFTAWEDRPGGVSRLALSKTDNGWTVEGALNVDFSGVNGTMINCFGSVSPWGTPLTSEENYMAYEVSATAQWNQAGAGGYPSYNDVKNIQAYLDGTFPNPYDYGYIVELTAPTGTPEPVKHFTTGRMAHENAIIMPDEKTVYLTSDGGFQGFFKFVADSAQDLSAGTLYAAKVTQDASSDNATTGFDIAWIELGQSDNATIETLIRSFDGLDENDFVDGDTNYLSQQQVDDYAAAYVAGGDNSALDPIAFLETNAVAMAMGATTEFNKMEGININPAGAASGDVPYMYVAMADVAGSMADDAGDIAITANRCGIVYRFDLEADFNVSRMEPAVVGGPYDSGATGDKCAVDSIAQPDNLYVMNDGRLLIGEDSGNHVNNMLWLYNPNAAE